MTPPKKLERCRISGSSNLIPVLNLGKQCLTGVFPDSPTTEITSGPLELVWCPESGLLQLRHSYDLGEMYGHNYGYRSGLNSSMVKHLANKARKLTDLTCLDTGDTVLDIGSNDATLLRSFGQNLTRIGVDPTANKFEKFYGEDIRLVPDFFSKDIYCARFGEVKPKIITSIAMFYDLENPLSFVSDIADILHDDGVWHFEQSYMPAMLRTNSYDTVCHEHLEYYTVGVVKKLLEGKGLEIIDVEMNSINGGSFAITAAKPTAPYNPNLAVINWLLNQEDRMNLTSPAPYRNFEDRVYHHREDLLRLIRELRRAGKSVAGYGASTKGNVLLQFCDLTPEDISSIAEVNPDKFGSYTPGTHIPILPEEEVKSMAPDYMLVLPWHFRDSILHREQEYLAKGGKLIFPLPEIEIV